MLFNVPDPQGGSSPPRGLPFSRVGPIGMILFLGVVVLSVFLLEGAKSGKTKAPGAPGSPGSNVPATPEDAAVEPDRFVRDPKIEVLGEGDLAAQYPETIRDELQTELFEWWQTPGRQMVADARDELEAEWVQRLLSDEVRPRLERLPGWVFGELAPIGRVLEEPGSHRGKLVQVWGAVAAVEEIALPTATPRRGWRVRLDDTEGRPWTAVTVHEPPEDVCVGRWAKAFGVFVKLRPDEAGRPSFVVFSAQKLLPSHPPVAHAAIAPEWAADVDDSTVEASQRKPGDEDAFWNLMNYVRTMGPDGWRAKVASGEIKVTSMTSARGATDLAQKPALHRFAAVRLRVGVGKGEGAFVTEPDLVENVGNIRSVFRGFVVDDQQRVIWALSPFPADAFPLRGARLATIEGFFYKRMAVEKKAGGLYWMPVVIVTAIDPIDTTKKPSGAVEQAVWIVLIGAVVCAVLLVVLVFRNRRAEAEVRRRHEARMAGRRNFAPGDRPGEPPTA